MSSTSEQPDAWRRRKLVQWTLAYLAGAWLGYEALSLVSDNFGWPAVVVRTATVVVLLGLPVTLVIAWYHGEQGRQRVTGPELVMIAALLCIAAVGLTLVGARGDVAAEATDPPLQAGVPLPGAAVHPRSIAVLPFHSLSDDPGDAYFADGIHEDILTHLSKVRDLRVISRTSVLQYKDERRNLREVGRELSVATILEGSVRRSGDRVRITAQLIDARTDEHLWAENFDREITDIFAIQTEVAQRIAAALRVNLSASERASIESTPNTNPRAYDFYLQARVYHSRPGNDRSDLLAAEQLYTRALEADPELALAYARLANVHSALYWYAHDRSEERLARAYAMLTEALRLDPDLPEARNSAGYYYYWGLRDYDRAQAELERAHQALPGNGEIFSALGYLHRRRGDWDAAVDQLSQAAELDPRNANVLRNLAETREAVRDYANAERIYTAALTVAPDLHLAALHRAYLYVRWHGRTDSLQAVLARLPVDFEPTLGSVPVAPRPHLALLERRPADALALLAAARHDVYEHQRYYYPGSLLAAFAHRLDGDSARARAAYDSARVVLEAARVRRPRDPRVHSALGLAYAGLGRAADAVRAGRRATELIPVDRDALDGPIYIAELAAIHATLGDAPRAIAELERLLRMPGGLSAQELRIDPRWDPIRQHPGFARLVS